MVNGLTNKADRSQFFTSCLNDKDWQTCAVVISKFAKSDIERRELRRRLYLAKGATALLKEGFAEKILTDIHNLLEVYGGELKATANTDYNMEYYSVENVLDELHRLANAAEDLASAIKEECYERGRKGD